jgi:hypothetical protein
MTVHLCSSSSSSSSEAPSLSMAVEVDGAVLNVSEVSLIPAVVEVALMTMVSDLRRVFLWGHIPACL